MCKVIDKLKTIQIKELRRFLIGGGTAVVVDFLAYKVLLHFQVSITVSKTVSYICGAAVGFVINKFWTFESNSKKTIIREIPLYIVLYTITAFANTLTNSAVIYLFKNKGLAFLCATGVSTVLNFLGQKYFVFRK